MTRVQGRSDDLPRAATDWHPRTELELAGQQLMGIARFTDAGRRAEAAAAAVTHSRELRMDAARAIEVVRRQHEALIARSHEQLRMSGDLRGRRAGRRAVLAHRSEWFLGRLTEVLEQHGVHVVAILDNGADAIGTAVAEQPDLVLVEDTLAMVPGDQVVRDIREYCPATLVAAQVAHDDRVGALIEAGAWPVFPRRVPPADVAHDLLELVRA